MVLILFAGSFVVFLAAMNATPTMVGFIALVPLVVGLYGTLRRISLLELICDLHPSPSDPPMRYGFDPDRMDKIRRLVDHGATPGERAAAAEALRRMGHRQ